ncbi:TetR family transcriptional regulator [Sciscionella sediminilitoris]|uniref:TetR family transcriptional regulator n=1 Tax=Sciscionella sediminilitoris TaxID=1445613 RepID=UPI00068C613F|nr:TetR family transcriptional regulator [Sciscionella sp. SE31]
MTIEQAAPDLVTRRKRDTERAIATAALELFETQGVAHTTAEQIAERAGVSPRTFFRYSPRKEDSVLLGSNEIHEIVTEELQPDRIGDDPIQAIERAFARGVAEFDNESSEVARHMLRMRRLATTEPLLTQALLRADLDGCERIVSTLARALGKESSDFQVRAILAVLDSTARIAFDEWARRVETGETPKVSELYAQARKAVRDAAST